MEARIVGLRGVGKTTLLEALSGGNVASGITAVRVVDPRIRELSEIFAPRKTTYAEFSTRDTEWPRAEGRRGDMDRYLDSLQGAVIFLHVLRAFDNPSLGTPIDTLRDLRELDHSFILSDLVTIERVLQRARKQPLSERDRKILERCQEALEGETPLRDLAFDPGDQDVIRGFGFRTQVPQVLLVNSTEDTPFDVSGMDIGSRRALAFPFPHAKEVAELPPLEQLEFAEALGLPGPTTEVVTRAVFEEMGLLSFFTVGEDEVRAWPVRRGATAVQAAGAIHSDLSRGFIRAETVSYEDFMANGRSLKTCRDAGVLRLEGKEYRVADGDILNIRFNV